MDLQQVISMILMRGGVDDHSMKLVKHLIVANLATKFLPAVGSFLKERLAAIKPKVGHEILQDPREPARSASMRLVRRYKLETEHNDVFDAVMWHVSLLPQTKFVQRSPNGNYTITNPDPIALEDGVFLQQKNIEFTEAGDVDSSTVEIFSHVRNLLEIREFVARVTETFRIHRQNRLGDQHFFFDEISVVPPRLIDGGFNLDAAPKNLTFRMSRMCTNKTLTNVYGESARAVRDRVRFFVQNPGWYADRGIPYTLGILLHGTPGCGKTSLIKAIANETKRHVFNVHLTDTTTVTQMNQFFHDDRVHVVSLSDPPQTFQVPMDKRILIMEDVDCLTDIVKARVLADGVSPHSEVPIDGQRMSLSHLLNLLDGVLETPGRIVVMTSNHPETLDPALLRPGRMDVHAKMTRCSRADVREMIEGIVGVRVDDDWLSGVIHEAWSPAETMQKIFENLHDMDAMRMSLEERAEATLVLSQETAQETEQETSQETEPPPSLVSDEEKIENYALTDVATLDDAYGGSWKTDSAPPPMTMGSASWEDAYGTMGL